MEIEHYGILLLVFSYMAAAILGGLLVISPRFRQQVGSKFLRGWGGLYAGLCGVLRRSHLAVSAAQQQGGEGFSRVVATFRRYRWLSLAALCLLLTPLGLVLILRGQIDTGSYDDGAAASNEVVAQLLQGEQLVPPPALPPEAFSVVEVEQIRPMLVSASRDWALLDEAFRQRLLLAFKLMEERYGYKMALLEGYRSPGRQNLLAGMGSSVTNAAAFQSYHQYGLAADCAFLRDDKLVISERDPWAMRGYQRYGEVAESVGLGWGGRWKMMDLGHVELRRPGVLGKPVTTN